jgi:cytochrome P450
MGAARQVCFGVARTPGDHMRGTLGRTVGVGRNKPPGPKGHFLLGVLPEIRRDELDFLDRLVREYGDVVYLRVVNHPVYLISHPRDIEDVLLVNHSNFVKSVFLRESRTLFGEGLLTSDGQAWVRQRRVLQPAFYPDRITRYSQIMVEHGERVLEHWQDGEVRDLHQDMARLTMEIIAGVLFGRELGSRTREAGEALHIFFDQFDNRLGLYFIPEWLPTPGNVRYRRAMKRLGEILDELIRQKRTTGHDSCDILSFLLGVRDDDGQTLGEREVRDEMMTLFFTGHETTALALSWTWYLLAQHPEVQEQLCTEVKRAVGPRGPTYQDLTHLSYVDWVVKESLRLYPPAYGVLRQAVKACEVGGYPIPAGATLAMFQWVVHRDPRFYDRPTEFIPERWADNLVRRLPRCAYFPFGVGPRVCIGNTFAATELILLVALVALRFRVELAPGQPVSLNPSLTLRPRPGVTVVLKKR